MTEPNSPKITFGDRMRNALAAEDLEIAWQLLRDGLPQTPNLTATAEQPTSTDVTTATPALQSSSTDDPTPTEIVQATPTPTP